MLRVRDVAGLIERWAPRDFAMEKDNVGLQVGDPASRVRRILVALDATEELVREAVRRNADLIVTHHPPLFRPVRTLETSTAQGRLLAALVRSGKALYAAHTNLDFAPGGTSFVLAERLGLQQVRFLTQHARMYRKVVTFVPATAVDQVAGAMTAAGGGIIGNYDACSFRVQGTGTFRGNPRSSPRVGTRGRFERVEEVRLEMLVDQHNLRAVLEAMKRTHPYEEVAFDIYPLENVYPGTGMGAIGTLRKSLTLSAFLRQIRAKLKTGPMRHTRAVTPRIRTVAVCGGAGTELLQEAVAAGADAFVTADVRYHAFRDAAGVIALIDAGHYETEFPVVNAVTRYLRDALRASHPRVAVDAATTRTSPIVIV